MTNINELQARQGNVDVVAEVIEVGEPREFSKFGRTGKVANAKIKDETGEVKLTLWNEQVDQVKVGQKVHLTNGWVGEYQGELQLSTGKFGKLEVVEEATSSEKSAEPASGPTPEPATEEPMTEELIIEEEKIE